MVVVFTSQMALMMVDGEDVKPTGCNKRKFHLDIRRKMFTRVKN